MSFRDQRCLPEQDFASLEPFGKILTICLIKNHYTDRMVGFLFQLKVKMADTVIHILTWLHESTESFENHCGG